MQNYFMIKIGILEIDFIKSIIIKPLKMKKNKFHFTFCRITILSLTLFISSCQIDDVDKSLFLGKYTVVQKCGNDTQTFVAEITDAPFSERSVFIENFPFDDQRRAIANIEGDQLVFPKQNDEYPFDGKGEISNNIIEIEFEWFSLATMVTTNCTATFTRN